MAIDIPSLFRDVIETPEQRQQRQMLERLNQAQSFMAPRGSVASLLNPLAGATFMNIAESQDRVKENLGGMLGLDMRDSSQKLSDALMAGDPNTPEGLRDLSKQLQNIFPAQSLGLLQAAREQEIADEERLAAKEQRDRQLSIMESEAETAKTRAETAQEQVEVDRITQTFNETVQKDLRDWRKMQVSEADKDRALEKEKMRATALFREMQKRELDVATMREMREIDEKAGKLFSEAAEIQELAKQFNVANYEAGMAGDIAAKWRSLTGDQTRIDLLKANFNKIINASVMDGLPPGVASDKDIELARAGFPDDSYRPEMIASYLAGMQKLSYIAAEKEKERLKFLAKNNGLPFMVDSETDEVVTFAEFWDKKKTSDDYLQLIEEKTGLDFLSPDEMAEYDRKIAELARIKNENDSASKNLGRSTSIINTQEAINRANITR